MKTIILVALVAIAIASAAVIPEEEEEEDIVVKRLFKNTAEKIKKFLKNGFKNIGDKIKEKFSKKKIKGVISLIKNKGEDVFKSITKVFKKSNGKKLSTVLVNLFSKKGGKYLGHFLDKSGKEIGHFFSKEIKGISHIKIFKNKKIEHFFKDVYEKAKQVARAVLSNKQFDSILHKLIGMIDSNISEKLCVEGAGKLIDAVTGSPASGKAVEPISKKICETGLKLLEMGVDHELKIVENKLGTSHNKSN